MRDARAQTERRRPTRAERLTILVGWSLFAVLVAARLLEATDFPRRSLEGLLRRELGLDEGELSLGDVELRWLERSLVLHELRIDDDLELPSLRLTLGPTERDAPPIQAITIDGGRLVWSDELRARLESWLDGGPTEGAAAWIPKLVVRDFELAARLPGDSKPPGRRAGDPDRGGNDADSAQRDEGREPERAGVDTEETPNGATDAARRTSESTAGARELSCGRLTAHLREDRDSGLAFEAHLVRREGGQATSVRLAGRRASATRWRVRLDARDLPLASEWLVGTELASLRALDPSARIDARLAADLHCEADASLPDWRRLEAADARLSLHEGELSIPSSTLFENERLRAIELDVRTGFDGRTAARGDWLDPLQWTTRVALEADLLGRRPRLGARLGAGESPELWIDLRDLELTDDLRARLFAQPDIARLLAMLEPEGRFDLRVAARPPLDFDPSVDWRAQVPMALVVAALDGVSVAYRGELGLDGRRVYGFPLRVGQVSGRALHTELGRLDRPFHSGTGLFAIEGRTHTGARVSAEGGIHGYDRAFLPGDDFGRFAFRLHVESPDLVIDDEVSRAFDGLAGVVPREEAWDRYGPTAGRIGLALDFWQDARHPQLAMRLGLDLDEGALRWAPIPVPLSGVRARVELSTDGRDSTLEASHFAARVTATGTHPAFRRPLELELFDLTAFRRETKLAEPSVESLVDHTQLRVGGINARHSALRAVVRTALPDVERLLGELDPQGFFDLLVTRERTPGERFGRTWLEVETATGENRVRPQAFDMLTEDVEGRAIVSVGDVERGALPPVTALASPIVGRWGTAAEPVPVAAHVRLAEGGELQLRLFGAGIRLENKVLLGSLGRAIAQADPDGGAPLDLSRTGLGGELDLGGRLTIRGPDDARELVPDLALYLRRGDFTLADGGGVPLLEEMRGTVRYDADGLGKGRVHARMRDTDLALDGLRIDTDGPRPRIDCRLSVDRLPIDRRHLEPFLTPTELHVLFSELGWRSLLTAEDGQLSIELGDEPGGGTLRFEGSVRVSETAGTIGLPVRIDSARLEPLVVVLEGDELRLWTRVRELYGALAGRRLREADLLASYIAPHLSIRELRGSFEGGSLESIGLEAGGSADFFSLDLAPPYRFRLAAEMNEVDAGELLRGIFNSSFANRGRLDASLALEGDLGKLLSIRGRGHVRLKDSSLWAIPVFQQLFAQLGFDTTATFRRMETRLAVEDGRIDMRDMRLKSDLLSLVGRGEVDFDGRMRHDLDVRYSLLDSLGLLTLLIYKVQEGLLHVTIGGDLSRPRVELGGLLSYFIGSGTNGERELPLPASSPLPPRF